MEARKSRIIVGKAGGTAGRNAKTYKLSLPSAWLRELGIGESARDVKLSFDGDRIIISKALSFEEFAKKKKRENHEIKLLSYYDGSVLCSRICADFTDRTLCVENEDVRNLKRAFGAKEEPDWEDFLAFLEERCVPRQRAGIGTYLEALGIDEYDPLEIVMRTQGKMAEDGQWLKIEEAI